MATPISSFSQKGRKKSIHGACNVFGDKEIIEYHPVLRQEELGKCTNKYEEEDVYKEDLEF